MMRPRAPVRAATAGGDPHALDQSPAETGVRQPLDEGHLGAAEDLLTPMTITYCRLPGVRSIAANAAR